MLIPDDTLREQVSFYGWTAVTLLLVNGCLHFVLDSIYGTYSDCSQIGDYESASTPTGWALIAAAIVIIVASTLARANSRFRRVLTVLLGGLLVVFWYWWITAGNCP